MNAFEQSSLPRDLNDNSESVVYTDENGQLLDTLPVCRGFRSSGHCGRASCKYLHFLEEHVEVNDLRVSVCRDSVNGRCMRKQCKYYHLPAVVLLTQTTPPSPPDTFVTSTSSSSVSNLFQSQAPSHVPTSCSCIRCLHFKNIHNE
ncbi:Zinc finger CCCH-type [Trinorchestia longiramus]|nr:Zinc finger CCCH-type [Trinorchestia longiramus]